MAEKARAVRRSLQMDNLSDSQYLQRAFDFEIPYRRMFTCKDKQHLKLCACSNGRGLCTSDY